MYNAGVLCVELRLKMSEENAIEKFEREAKAFYRETGVMAPGKDVPCAIGGYDERQLRHKLFNMWAEKEHLRERFFEIEVRLREMTVNRDNLILEKLIEEL